MFIVDIIKSIIGRTIYDSLIKPKIVQQEESLSIKEPNNDNISIDETIQPKTIKEQIGERLSMYLDMINSNRYKKHTYDDIADKTNRDDLGIIEGYFNGTINQPLSWISHFSESHKVSKRWIASGEGAMFQNNLVMFSSSFSQLTELFNKYLPTRIIYLRDSSEHAHCCIIFMKDDFDFKIIHKESNWKISDKTGSHGQGDTLSYYKFIKYIEDNGYSFGRLLGSYTISETNFFELIYGKKHPNFLKGTFKYWDQDLLDLEHKRNNIEVYKRWHGDSFLNAQEVIKFQL